MGSGTFTTLYRCFSLLINTHCCPPAVAYGVTGAHLFPPRCARRAFLALTMLSHDMKPVFVDSLFDT
jgi:hypothetical protein